MAEATFGERLAEARRKKGETIEEVSEQLRIRPSIILAMETSNYSHMPHKGYARNMVSSYARYLGLDSTRLTEQFLREFRRWESTGKQGVSGNVNSVIRTSSRMDPPDVPQLESERRRDGRETITAAKRNVDRSSVWRGEDTRETDRKFREQLRQVQDDRGVRQTNAARQGSTARRGSAGRQANTGRKGRAVRQSSAPRRTSARRATTADGEPQVSSRRLRTNEYVGRHPQKSFLVGILSGLMSRPIVLIAGLVIAFVAILILWAVLANTCSSNNASNVPVTGVTGVDEGLSEDQASNSVGDIEAQIEEDNRYGPFELVVEVAEGESWLQIDVDGETKVGEVCVAPWTASYTVASSCRIEAGAPANVKVFRNGIEATLDTSGGTGVLELEVEQRPIVQNAQDTDAVT